MSIEDALTVENMKSGAGRGAHHETKRGAKEYLPNEEVITRARQYAAQKHSFSFAAQLLGMTNKRLRRILEEENASIQFIPGIHSRAAQGRIHNLHESNRGKFQQPTPAVLAALARGREKRCTRYTAFGVTGYLRELKEHFHCKLAIQTLRDRIKSGMSVEEAITKPAHRASRGVYPPQLYDWLIKRRTMAAAEIMVIARNRVTPTMLQYREPEHDIRIVARDGSCITVEVRTEKDGVLHQLSFLKTFESGVLFVFRPEINNRLQFIAFEPDSEALQETAGAAA